MLRFAWLWIVVALSASISLGAEIAADPSAPGSQRPEVLPTGGGVPQVNIKTPNAAGLSYNRYSQFDVGRPGAILNNSRDQIQTQLAGWIEGNPNLNHQSASLIVNEVNSSRPSSLQGYVEVAGPRADVVIANPAGINVDGFGFINANRGVLTTGKPQFGPDGGLAGYQVDNGHIAITGSGLDGRNTNYTDIISRTVAINAGIWANNLTIATGNNYVAHGTNQVTNLGQNSPQGVSLDVSALGGMYAGAIRLVGTDKGLGVRNAGNIVANVGEVVITADGRLETSGMISGQTGATFTIGDSVANQGRIQSGGDIAVSAAGGIDTGGQIVSLGDIDLKAKDDINNQGLLQANGALTVDSAAGAFNSAGDIAVGGAFSMQSKTGYSNDGHIEAGGDIDLTASAGNLANRGGIESQGSVTLTSSGAMENQGVIPAKENLAVTAGGSVTNDNNMIAGGNAVLSAQTGSFTNSGVFAAGGDMAVDAAGSLANSGKTSAAGRLNLSVGGAGDNAGTIVAGKDLTLSVGGSLTTKGEIGAVGKADIAVADDMTNNSLILSDDDLTLTVGGSLDSSGEIGAAGTLSATVADSLTNTGKIVAEKAMTVGVGRDLTTSGEISAQQGLSLDVARNIANGGKMLSGKELALTLGGGMTSSGEIAAAQKMTVEIGDNLVNDGKLLTQSDLTLSVGGDMATSDEIASGGGMALGVGGNVTNQGKLVAGRDMNLTAGGSLNTSGELGAVGSLDADIGGNTENSGKILAGSGMQLKLGGELVTSDEISAGGNLDLQAAGSLDNTGAVLAGKNLRLGLGGDLATDGEISAAGDLDAGIAGAADNYGKILAGGGMKLNIGGGLTTSDEISARDNLTLGVAGNATNSGAVLAGNDLSLTVGGALATSGELGAVGSVSAAIGGDTENTGKILGGGAMDLNIGGGLATSAEISARDSLTLNVANAMTASGIVLSEKDLTLTLGGDLTAEGELGAGGTLTAGITGNVDNTGKILADSGMKLDIGGKLTTSDEISAHDSLTLGVGAAMDNSGLLLSGNDLNLTVGASLKSTGEIGADQRVVAAVGGNADFTGKLLAGGSLDLNVGGSLNTGKEISSGGKMQATVGDKLVNTGKILSDSAMTLTIGGRLDTSEEIAAGGDVTLDVTEDLHNDGKILAGKNLALTVGGGLESGVAKTDGQASMISEISSGGDFDAAIAGSVVNDGKMLAGGGMKLELGGGLATSDEISANDKLTITVAGDMNNSGLALAGKDFHLNVDGGLTTDGELGAAGSMQVAAGDDIVNTGKILTNSDLTLTSGGSLSTSNEIAASNNATLDIATDMTNTGKVVAGNDLALTLSGGLTNSGELGAGGKLTAGIGGDAGNSGKLLAGAALDVTVGGSLQTSREIAAADAVQLKIAGAMDNAGTVAAGGAMAVTVGGGLTTQGELGAVGSLDLGVDGDIANSGVILSETSLTLSTGGKLDSSGELSSGGAMTAASAGDFLNSGKVLANNALSLTVGGNLHSTDELGAGGSLTASVADDMENKGRFLAGGDMDLTVGGQLATDGELGANGTLTAGIGGSVNSTGNFLAGNDMSLTVGGGLTSNGELGAQRNLKAAIDQDVSADGKFASGSAMNLDFNGNFTNNADLSAGATLNARIAGSVSNTGRIVAGGDQFTTIGGDLFNTGLMDGETTVLRARSIENYGTGSLLGTHLAIEAENVINGLPLSETGVGTSGLIGARDRLDLGFATLLNREDGTLYSGGDLYIGNKLDAALHAVGSARTMTNTSAYIDSLGDIYMEVDKLENNNAHFATAVREVPDSRKTGMGLRPTWSSEIEMTGQNNTSWNSSHGANPAYWRGILLDTFVCYEGLTIYDTETYVTESRPGLITAMGDITVLGNIRNDKSRIIAGNIFNHSGGEFESIGAIGVRSHHEYTPYARVLGFVDDGDRRPLGDYFVHLVQSDTNIDLEVVPDPDYGASASVGDKTSASGVSSLSTPPVDPTGSTVPTASAVSGSSSTSDSSSASAASAASSAAAASSASAASSTSDASTASDASATSTASAASTASGTSAFTGPVGVSDAFFNPVNLNANLFTANPSSTSNYLVESNPLLTDRRLWLSSDFMLQRMNVDPATVQKRLGDGYYEQRLVREQIMQQTGQRFIGSYANDEEQYKALMLAGVDFAEQFNWSFGMTMTPEIMAELTYDIVWLEYVSVDTPDGPMTVLTPKVYLAPGRDSLIDPKGTLVAAREVNIDAFDGFNNSGAIYGSDSVAIAGTDLTNGGTIAGRRVSLAALQDISNIGGNIVGVDSVKMQAGRDITVASSLNTTNKTTATSRSSVTSIGSVGSVSVTSDTGALNIDAGRDLSLLASRISSAGTGSLSAGHDILAGTVDTSYDFFGASGRGDHSSVKKAEEVGSSFSAVGDLTLTAGHDISVRAGQLHSDADLALKAANDVSIVEGRASSAVDTSGHYEKSGFFSKTKVDIADKRTTDESKGSIISGKTVTVDAGNDVLVRGSAMAASGDLSLQAGNDITITGAENHVAQDSKREYEHSGFFLTTGGGRLSLGYEDTRQGKEISSREQNITSSLVGSTTGNVTLQAGKDVGISGGDVAAGTGDIHISGENVTIENMFKTTDYDEHSWLEKTKLGLTLGLTSGVGNIIDGVVTFDAGYSGNKKIADGKAPANYQVETLNDILQLGGAYKVGSNIYDIGKNVITTAQDPNQGIKGGLKAGFGDTGVSVGISLGTSKIDAYTTRDTRTAVSSTVKSGGDTSIVARGDGNTGTGDIKISGSQVDAGGKVDLSAANNLLLESAANTSESSKKQNTTTSSIGVNFDLTLVGKKVNFGGITEAINVGFTNVNNNSSSTKYAETVVKGKEGVTFTSGNDTTLKGAQISGKEIVGNVGGDFAAISQQDTSRDSQASTSINTGISVGISSGMASGSLGMSATNADSDYRSVVEHSGIFAGEDGFSISVGGNTGLVGAAINSKADESLNSLVTGTITTQDIQNNAHYEADGWGFNATNTYPWATPTGDVKDKDKDEALMKATDSQTGLTIIPNPGLDESGGNSSTTKSVVAPGTVIILDPDAQMNLTGQTATEAVEALNRDTASAHTGALPANPNIGSIVGNYNQLNGLAAKAGVAITAITEDISKRMKKLAIEADDEATAKKWDKGGDYSTILNAAGTLLKIQYQNGEGLESALGMLAGYFITEDYEKFTAEATKGITDPAQKAWLTNTLNNAILRATTTAVGGTTAGNNAVPPPPPAKDEKSEK